MIRLAALVCAALAIATGFLFHAMDYGTLRDRWFAAHVGVSCLSAALLVIWIWRARTRAAGAIALQITIALTFLTGWLAFSAWPDRGNIDRWLGGLALPSLPGISYAVGEFGERMHKLAMPVLLLIAIAMAARAIWRRIG